MTARGKQKRDIFYDDADFEEYKKLMVWYQQEVPFHLYAYCLMTNHVRLLMETLHLLPGEVSKHCIQDLPFTLINGIRSVVICFREGTMRLLVDTN